MFHKKTMHNIAISCVWFKCGKIWTLRGNCVWRSSEFDNERLQMNYISAIKSWGEQEQIFQV